MSDRNHSKADSNRSIEQKKGATVVDTSGPSDDPDVFLVEYPDGSVEYEPATPENVALFQSGLYDRVQGVTSTVATVGDRNVDVRLQADIESGTYDLSIAGDQVPVPREYVTDIINAFDGAQGAALGSRLYSIYEDIIEGQIRRYVVSQFEDRFPDDRVEVTPDGWEVDDTFVVTYDVENYLIDIDPVSPNGNGYDSSKQGVYLDLNATSTREVRTPDGDRIELEPDEQEFLAMVEGLLYPEDYFGANLVDDIEQHKAEGEAVGDVIEQVTSDADVGGFTDSKTGIHHGSTNHSFQKHDVSDLNVTEDVREKLWSNPYDHAAVHEMLLRKQEFVNNPDIDIFTDDEDDSDFKWSEIENTSEHAPIPSDVRNKLDSMFA